jgi:hypothetical protein
VFTSNVGLVIKFVRVIAALTTPAEEAVRLNVALYVRL